MTTLTQRPMLLACSPCVKGGRGACGGTCEDGWLRQYRPVPAIWGEVELVGIRDEHDITKPPAGCQPVRCTAGCDDGLVDIPRGVVGPVLGTALGPDEVTTMLRPAKCRACFGRGWVWGVE